MSLNDDSRLKLELVLEAAKENSDALSDWEIGFMSSTQERYDTYKDAIRFSEKQWAVIERVWDKVGPR